MEYKKELYKPIENYDIYQIDFNDHVRFLEISYKISEIIKRYVVGEFLNYLDFNFMLWCTNFPQWEIPLKKINKPIIRIEVIEQTEKLKNETIDNNIGLGHKIVLNHTKTLKFIDIEENYFIFKGYTNILELYKEGV